MRAEVDFRSDAVSRVYATIRLQTGGVPNGAGRQDNTAGSKADRRMRAVVVADDEIVTVVY